MPDRASADLALRLRQVRVELYGEGGGPHLAASLGIPARTLANYEAGVIIPGEVALRFVMLTGVRPGWLLTGEGPRRGPLEPSDQPDLEGAGSTARHPRCSDANIRPVVATPCEASQAHAIQSGERDGRSGEGGLPDIDRRPVEGALHGSR